MTNNDELLLEVLIENRELEKDLKKSSENSSYWFAECQKAREDLRNSKEAEAVKPDGV